MSAIDAIMRIAPVIPVMIIEREEDAVPLAGALVKGGLPVLEITLRTPVAMTAIERIIGEIEGAIVGAGTITESAQLEAVEKLGCRFAVSPGATPRLVAAAKQNECPLLPGASSASEVMYLLENGIDRQKFFPAGPAGGPEFLKALASPLPRAKFCPTGGVGPGNASTYLKLQNVLCVGGSWVTPKEAVAQGDWQTVEALAREAAALAV